MNSVPVALFAYARPDHLQQVLAGIKANRVPLLYAFVDGPADPSKTEVVNQVIGLLKSVDWTELHLTIREQNLGLAGSIRSGITEVLKKHEHVVVLEDDIVMRPGAYAHTVAALLHYESDERVMSVSMWSQPSLRPKTADQGFFSERFICWGWATYRKYWSLYQESPFEIYNKCLAAGINVDAWGADIKWQAENAEKKKLWYIGYALTHMLHRKLSYFPEEALAVNIGRDGSGENTGGGKQDDLSLIHKPVGPLMGWPVDYDPSIKNKFARYFNPVKRKSVKEFIYSLYKHGIGN
jgi:hypothetical protein